LRPRYTVEDSVHNDTQLFISRHTNTLQDNDRQSFCLLCRCKTNTEIIVWPSCLCALPHPHLSAQDAERGRPGGAARDAAAVAGRREGAARTDRGQGGAGREHGGAREAGREGAQEQEGGQDEPDARRRPRVARGDSGQRGRRAGERCRDTAEFVYMHLSAGSCAHRWLPVRVETSLLGLDS
jgi:hypothetical protein